MKSKSTYTFSVASVLLAATLLAACSAATPDKKSQLDKLKVDYAKLGEEIKKLEAEIGPDSTVVNNANAKEVVVTTLEPKSFDHFLETHGAVESTENVEVSARTAGTITQVFAVEGEVVTKGRVLAQTDNQIILQNIEEVKSSLALATTVYERQKNLWDQKIGTEVQYLQAKNNKESLESRLASLREQNDMTMIKSPINGVVDEVNMKVGQSVSPGMPAARIVNNKDLKIKANVSEAYVTQIRKGNKALVTIGDSGKQLEATVTFVGQNINALSRTFVVEIKLPSLPELRPNMSAVVRLIFASVDKALVVPVNVVQDINGQKVVYTVDESGKTPVARRRTVEIVGVYGTQAEIKSGLNAGDKLITVGYQGLNDGEVVKL